MSTAAVLALAAPATAAPTTVNAQLSMTGVATKSNVLGGSVVGIHPGDTVVFSAATVPTAGLDTVPSLGGLLGGLAGLNSSNYQVVLHLPAGFPSGPRDVILGGNPACGGQASVSVLFAAAGTYNFTWNANQILSGPSLLDPSCQYSDLGATNGNQLQAAGVKLNASNQWVGQVVAATNPPAGGISIQLPTLSVAPSLPVVGQLPTLSVPGTTVTAPGLPAIPGTGASKPPAGATTAGPGTRSTGYTPPGLTVPQQVMPLAGAGSGGFFGAALPDNGSSPVAGAQAATVPGATATKANIPSGSGPAAASGTTKRIELAANKAPAAPAPVLLAVIAIIALSLVTATYARLYLLRRHLS